MNKKEIRILATREQVLFEKSTFWKKTCRYYYEVAVKNRKRGNIEASKKDWQHCKESFVDYEKASARWNVLFEMTNLLGIDTDKYYELMDKSQVLPEKGAHMSIKTDKFDYRFLCNMHKMLLKGGK